MAHVLASLNQNSDDRNRNCFTFINLVFALCERQEKRTGTRKKQEKEHISTFLIEKQVTELSLY